MSGLDAGLAWLAGQAQAQAELIDSLDEPAWLVDGPSGTLRHANAAAADWLGEPPQALIGRDAALLLPSLEDQAFWAEARTGWHGPLCSEVELADAQGRDRPALRRVVRLPGGDPTRPDWLVTLRDLSRERDSERASEALAAELRATLEATADGVLVTGLSGRVRVFNRRFASLWKLPESALSERDDVALRAWLAVCVADPGHFAEQFDEAAGELLSPRQWRVRLADGTELDCRSQPQWSAGRPIGRVHNFRPRPATRGGGGGRLTEVVDAWTGLPDRAGLLRLGSQALEQARREGTQLALLCVELDRQALYGLGHQPHLQARSLNEVAQTLRAGLRGPHVLARLGSTRFGLLLPQTSEVAAEVVVRRWLALSDTQGPGPNLLAGLNPVAGLAVHPQAAATASDLLLAAESALMRARMLGQRWSLHVPSEADTDPRLIRLVEALSDGVAERSPFQLHFQPRRGTAHNDVQALEALVRWREPLLGELMPAQFLPWVERAGLLPVLDDWVLETAVRQAAQWRALGHDWPVVVNVGGASLARPGLARRVAAVLKHWQVPAEGLELDVTEAALVVEPDAALCTVRALRDLGVAVVLDDFGAGNASVNLLRRFPLSAVKIDRSLLRGVPHQAGARALVDGLVSLVRALGLPVSLEGVETPAQRQLAGELGCCAWQGFLDTQALPATRLLARLAQDPPTS